MKNLTIPAFLVVILSFPVMGQFTDDFSDGFLHPWHGDTSHFKINTEGQLQLNAPSGVDHTWIYTNTSFSDSTVWEIFVKMDFAPSGSNRWKLYLAMDGPDPVLSSGYFIQIGVTGNSDAIDFYLQEAGIQTLVASSEAGLVAAEPVEINLKIVRQTNGLWSFFAVNEQQSTLLFQTVENTFPPTSFGTLGMEFFYTDTRRDKFFIDDIQVYPLVADTTPPSWIGLIVANQYSVTLEFDEPLHANASDPAHYILVPGNLSPGQVIVNQTQVTLIWDQPFTSQLSYMLVIDGIQDEAGNILPQISRPFLYQHIGVASAFDILITEIMADPNPVIGLPDAEYIEIYNRSNAVLDLGEYSLKIGTTVRAFPDSLISPGEFLIVTDDQFAPDFTDGKVLLQSFPSITNSGTSITLMNDQGIIHEVKFDDTWYGNAAKQSGGWSLEMNNPNLLCAGKENWSATIHLSGGTPGKENSIWLTGTDEDGPVLLSVYPENDNRLLLFYDEKIDSLLSGDPSGFYISPSIDVADVLFPESNLIRLIFTQPLEEGMQYALVADPVFDCMGNISNVADTFLFGKILVPQAGDILINEILPDPESNSSRYIELINTTNKFFDVAKLSLGRIENNIPDVALTGVQKMMEPHQIIAFATDRESIIGRYFVANPSHLFTATMPSWDDESDHAAVMFEGIVLDSFTYHTNWHHPALQDLEGVSLERISLTQPASDPANWHSAASTVNYGTPTGINSQVIIPVPTGIRPFTLVNSRFSPDNDGFKDFLGISIEPDDQNSVASLWIYDLEGREIFQVLSNETLGNSAFVQWDGRNADGKLADMGIYLILLRLWNASGSVTEYRETCALIKR